MEKYQAVFSDMDGTLLNSRHQISERTLKSIQKIIKQQIPFILVSARPPQAMLSYVRQLGCTDGVVCYNGALILDANLQTLQTITLTAQDLATLQQYLAKYPQDIVINYYHGLDWFVANIDHIQVQQEQQITGCQPQLITKPLTVAHKLLLMATPPLIAQLEQQLRKLLPHLAIHRSKPDYLEIMHKQASKANAIKFMLNRLNLSTTQAIAFGDNFNDLDMLTYVGLSVAMGNSPAEIKAKCSRITADNDNDGIALVLESLFP